MYIGHARLCACLSVPRHMHALLHVTGCNLGQWWVGRCPLFVHYAVDLQSVHGFRCYGNMHVSKDASTHCTAGVVVETCRCSVTSVAWQLHIHRVLLSCIFTVFPQFLLLTTEKQSPSASTLCSKKRPTISYDCSFYKCWPISIIFGTDYIELMCNIIVIYLLTSPTYCCYTTLGNKSSA